MSRRVVLLAFAAIACDAPPAPVEPAPPAWVYAPAPTGWPMPIPRARFGRAQAPQQLTSLGIAATTSAVRGELAMPTLWPIPGDAARAAVYAVDGTRVWLELIDVDAGTVLWRSDKCIGPVVGVTDGAILCSNGTSISAIGVDGVAGWTHELPFVAMAEDRLVLASAGESVIVDATTGTEISSVKLPPAVMSDTIVASCGDAGRELFATTVDHKLQRVADVKGKPAVTWSMPVGVLTSIEACEGDHVIAVSAGSLVAFDRTTGAQTGRIDDVAGYWPARDGSAQLEVATSAGISLWPRSLAASVTSLSSLPVGELIAKRGDRRLVRGSDSTMVLLDRTGVVAYLALSQQSAVLGDRAILAGSWEQRAATVQRVAIPERYRRTLRLPPRSRGVAPPAELRDLPAMLPLATDAITKRDTGTVSVGPLAIDPRAPSIVYVAASEHAVDADRPSTIAAIDLATKQWLWQRSGGCGPGEATAVAVTTDVVVCSATGAADSTVRATSREGIARWEFSARGVDALVASGSLVIVTSGDRAHVLDAATGTARMQLANASGTPVHAALVETAEWGTLLVAAEHGQLVARSSRVGMLPLWSLGIDGVVSRITTAGDGVLVELEDGDAYRVLADATVIGVPALGLTWLAGADVLAGMTEGGPIYGERVAPKPGLPVRPIRRRTPQGKPIAPENPEMPRLWTPIAPPPIAGASHQVALYEPTGGLRVRADYGLVGQVAFAPRGPAGSPIVIVDATMPARALVLDPRTGDPLKHVELTAEARVFATIVGGSPVAGAVLPTPLRVVVF